MKKLILIILLLPFVAKAQINHIKNMMIAHSFMPYNGQLFFYGNDGINAGLWKTDGTTPGTVFVKSLNGGEVSLYNVPIISNNILYFNVFATLWRTDGTPSGTFPLTSGINVSEKVDLNGTLIFMGEEAGVSGNELWKTDGTVQGTTRIIDFLPGSSPGVRSTGRVSLVAQDNFVYFIGDPTSQQNYFLCKTNGTAAGTQVVDNTLRISTGLYSFQNKIFTVGYKQIEILPNPSICGYASLHKIIQINNGVVSDFWLPPTYNANGCGPIPYPELSVSAIYFRRTNNNLFFLAYNYTNLLGNSPTAELRKIDGNSASVVKNFRCSSYCGPDPFAFQMPSDDNFFENIFYFQREEAATGYEVWRSDGTESGTYLIDVNPGPNNSNPFEFRTINGITYFAATNNIGRKLYQTDGTNAGTFEVNDPNNVLFFPNSTNQNNTGNNQINYFSNKLGSKLIFVGTSNAIGNPTALFSVCTPPQAPALASNVVNNTVCFGSQTSLTATNCSGTVTWSTGASTSTINVSPTSATTYTATCTEPCGTSPIASITINVTPLATVPSISQTGTQFICPNTSISLSASGCNGTVAWSSGATGSAITVSSAGTYSATCTNICNTSASSSQLIVIGAANSQSLSGTALNGISHAGQTIVSTQIVNNGTNSVYKAGKSITLNPNFQSQTGAVFKAEIGNACPITNGLVLHLPFDGNTNDISGGNNNGTASNLTLTTDRDGKPNSAYYFNGTNAYISVPNNPSFSGNTELTLSVWIRPEDLNGTYRGIITKWFQNASSDTYSMLLANTNQILAAVKGNPEIFSGMISANNWIQVVYTHSSTLDKIYINGVLVSTINVSVGVASTTIPIIIGADNNNGTIWRFFKGKIDEVKIYNRALTIQEIEYQYAYESIPTNINTGLVADYNLDNNFTDQSGNGHNATFASAILTTGRKGIANTAYSFNGINNRINLGTWFNLQTFTISMWLNAGSTQANAYAMIFDNNHGGNLMWNMQQRNTTLNQYDFGLSGSPGTGQAFNLTPNQWTHIVITCNGSTLSLYKDGILSGSSTYTGPIIYNGTQSMCLGAYVNGGNYVRFWNGKMDDIKIYNRAISAVEVSYLFSE